MPTNQKKIQEKFSANTMGREQLGQFPSTHRKLEAISDCAYLRLPKNRRKSQTADNDTEIRKLALASVGKRSGIDFCHVIPPLFIATALPNFVSRITGSSSNPGPFPFHPHRNHRRNLPPVKEETS